MSIRTLYSRHSYSCSREQLENFKIKWYRNKKKEVNSVRKYSLIIIIRLNLASLSADKTQNDRIKL